MCELTGKIHGVSYSYETGNPLITFEMGKDALGMVDELKGEEKLTVTVKKYAKKRSLDANAYFHVLVNKIAAKVKSSDDEVKKNLVMSYGTLARDEDGNLIGATIPAGMSLDAFYPYTRNYKTVMVNGKECNCYLFYKRTRDLDSKEMAHLIEGAIYEARNLGIETRTPEEIDSLINSWGGNK